MPGWPRSCACSYEFAATHPQAETVQLWRHEEQTTKNAMAETIELANKREAERRLALLALAGEQPEPSGSCLDPEELAALIEGRLAPEQVEPCLAHLAGCEHCYALWLQLDRDWREQAGKSGRNRWRRLISRPPFLAAAGSLLAAAASIAVFLTITTQADRQALTRLPEQPVQEQVLSGPVTESSDKTAAVHSTAPSPPDAAIHPSEPSRITEQAAAPATPPTEGSKKKALSRTDRNESGALDAAVPAQPPGMAAKREKRVPQVPMENAKPAGKSVPATAGMMEDKKEQEATSLPEKSAATLKAAPQAAVRATGTPAPAGDTAPLTVAAWHNRIRAGCQDQRGPEYFADLSQQGIQLLRQSAALHQQEQRQVERLLGILGNQQSAGQQCRALLEILGPAEQGPKQ